MNVTAVASLFFAITLIPAILFGFFFPQGSVLFLFIGLVGSIIMLYIGIQQTGTFYKSPFWVYIAFVFLAIIILILISWPIYNAVMDGAWKSYLRTPGIGRIPGYYFW
jgi:hypothetical protein